ncbi:unnamed protein product [Polarella glacialis]|uniref:Uncharacterized protein n=1 Tax=Polarella glacialis TaxID=89957 RepID=A0A813L2X5_POLGL|nr:unnamed protein product [Polarella glacialis]
MASAFSSEEVEFAVADKSVPWERGITTGSTNYYDCCSEIGRDDNLDDDFDNDYEVPGRSVGFVSSGCEETCEADYDNNSEFPKRSFCYVPHDYKGQERLFGFVSSKEILAREEMYEVPERSCGFTPVAASQSRKSPLKTLRTTPVSTVQEDDDDLEIPERSCGFLPEACKMRSPLKQDLDYELPQRSKMTNNLLGSDCIIPAIYLWDVDAQNLMA